MNTFNMKTPLATLVTLCAAFSAVQAQADAGYGSSSAEGLSNYISVGVTAASERQGHPSPGRRTGNWLFRHAQRNQSQLCRTAGTQPCNTKR